MHLFLTYILGAAQRSATASEPMAWGSYCAMCVIPSLCWHVRYPMSNCHVGMLCARVCVMPCYMDMCVIPYYIGMCLICILRAACVSKASLVMLACSFHVTWSLLVHDVFYSMPHCRVFYSMWCALSRVSFHVMYIAMCYAGGVVCSGSVGAGMYCLIIHIITSHIYYHSNTRI